jgi:hypothetical protein
MENREVTAAKEFNYSKLFWMDNNKSDNIVTFFDIMEDTRYRYDDIIFTDMIPDDDMNDDLVFYTSQYTGDFVAALNICIEADELDPIEYGLSSPVTLNDVLNKRDEVSRLFNEIDALTYREYWGLQPQN